MIPAYICAAIALYAALRTLAERDLLKKMPYLNVLNFAITATIVLAVPHPLSLAAAAAYFIGATLESNAIASAYAGGEIEND